MRLPACAALLALAAALPAAELDTVQLHGFISQGYVLTSANGYYDPDTCDGGSLEFREIAFSVIAQPQERLRLGIQVMSQDVGNMFNNTVEIDWASAVYTVPFAGWEGDVKVGRIKLGHGLYNDYRDLDFSRATIFLPESIYYNSWRRLYVALDGVGVELRSPATAVGTFQLNAVVGNQQLEPDDPSLDWWGVPVATTDLERQWAVQLSWRPSEDLLLKASYMSIDNWYTTFDDTAADPLLADEPTGYSETIASLEWTHGSWQVAAEGTYWLSTGTQVYGSGRYAYDESGIGGYVCITYDLTPAWRVAVQGQAHNGTYKYEGYDTEMDQCRAIGVASSYAITDHWLVKAEFDYVDGTYFLRGVDQPVPDEFESDEWNMLSLRTTFDF